MLAWRTRLMIFCFSFSFCFLRQNSLNVSNINSLATVTWEDFLSSRYKNVKDKQQLNAIKYLAFIYGVIILGIAYCVGFLSGVIESAMLTGSATTGPLVGVFLLAMLVPIANAKVRNTISINSVKCYCAIHLSHSMRRATRGVPQHTHKRKGENSHFATEHCL